MSDVLQYTHMKTVQVE